MKIGILTTSYQLVKVAKIWILTKWQKSENKRFIIMIMVIIIIISTERQFSDFDISMSWYDSLW